MYSIVSMELSLELSLELQHNYSTKTRQAGCSNEQSMSIELSFELIPAKIENASDRKF